MAQFVETTSRTQSVATKIFAHSLLRHRFAQTFVDNPNDGLVPTISDTGAAQEVLAVAPDTVADVSMVPDQQIRALPRC